MSDEKKHGLDIGIKLIGVALTIGGIVFSAGVLSEKLKHIEENQRAADGMHTRRVQRDDDRYEKLNRAVEELSGKVDGLAEQMKQARPPRRRHRDADSGGIDTRP